ncbi:hypothetical protein JCM18909_2345 [Cutibacterium acnes JCM 18909]|nr:hypothetical protein JCM18909_2345 [Cutibacterium acnes JCM 18909]
MGLLESIRRGVEFLMNVVVIGALALWSGHTTTVMRGFAIAYTLVLVPLILALLRRVPKNAVAGDAAGKGGISECGGAQGSGSSADKGSGVACGLGWVVRLLVLR